MKIQKLCNKATLRKVLRPLTIPPLGKYAVLRKTFMAEHSLKDLVLSGGYQ